MTQETGGLSRRSIIRGAAWSVPVIAVAVATPLAAASGEEGAIDNGQALYYWNEAANASAASLHYDNLTTPSQGTWSVQVSLRAEAWDLPSWPSDAVAILTVEFDEPIVVAAPPAGVSGSGTTWSFVYPLTSRGATPSTYFNFQPAAGGAWPTTSVVRVNVTNPGPLTWPTQGVQANPSLTQFDPGASFLVP